MLILGLKVSNVLLATLYAVCDVCGVSAAHEVVKRVRRLSVFFIPVLSLGARYQDVCTFCGRTMALSADDAERAAAQAHRTAARAPWAGNAAGVGPQESPQDGPPQGAQGSAAWPSGPQDTPSAQTPPAWR
jgi:hypothetical protein